MTVAAGRGPQASRALRTAESAEAGAHRGLGQERPAASGRGAASLEGLPVEAVHRVGRFLAPVDLGSARAASRRLDADLRPLFRAAQISRQLAPRVRTIEGFRRLVGPAPGGQPAPDSVLALPPPWRDEPLAALGSRILALPDADRAAAIADFLSVHSAGRSDLLVELRQAAIEGVQAMHRREWQLVHGGPAAAAVQAGRRVQDVASAFGISGSTALLRLETLAISRALDWLRSGQTSVPQAAQRLGVTSEHGLLRLQMRAVDVHGALACFTGQVPQEVARRLGITHPLPLQRLDFHAAAYQVRTGRRPEDAIESFGIAPGLESLALFHLAVDTAGREAIQAGSRVSEVAERLGVEDMPLLVSRLELIAALDVGLPLVRGGLDPLEVAARLGIRNLDNVLRLFEWR